VKTIVEQPTEGSYQFGRFRIEVEERLLLRDGKPLPLSGKAFDTLLILIERKGQVVDKQQLLEIIWPDTAVEENNLTQVISTLRRALGQDSHGRSYIETVPRRGYRFVGSVSSGADSDLRQTNTQHRLSQRLRALHEGTQRAPPLWFIVALAVTAGLTLVAISRQWVPSLFRARGAAETIPPNVSVAALNQGRYVIVLPFEVGSGQKSLDYLAEGLAEALTTKLRRLPGIQAASLIEVAGPVATRSLKEIARKSGANFIVQGSIRGTPENMQVTVVLHDACGHRDLWKEQFPAATSDILSVEDRIFSRLAKILGPERPDYGTTHSTHPTQDMEAYDLYLKGRNAPRYHQDAQDLRASVSFFGEALKRDPRFALAYAGLANASVQMYHETKDSLWIAKALNAAEQARSLNDDLPEAHAALGNVYTAYGRGQDGVKELQRALELAPNSDENYRWLGRAYVSVDRTQEGLQAYQRAVALNPYYWLNYNVLGIAYFQTGDYERALNAFRRVVELEPGNVYGYENFGNVNLRLGRWNESISSYEEALRIRPNFAIYSNLGTAYFYLKRYGDAAKMFLKAVEINPNDETVAGNLADAYRWSGQTEKALAAYRKAIALAYRELQVNPDDATTTGHLALYYARRGDVKEGLVLIHRARALDHANVRLIYNEATLEALAGNTHQALDCLREAFEKGYPASEAGIDPEFKGIRNRPEFQRLVTAFSSKKG
jgi:tetratricopeptide (TPR) repeat protein/DNA-binding winged helix-turn-helix (wHTH) protein/TolB-like protein